MGISYEGSILLGVYCTKGSNWMHQSRRLSASNLTYECNKHLTILNLNIVFPLLHGIAKKVGLDYTKLGLNLKLHFSDIKRVRKENAEEVDCAFSVLDVCILCGNRIIVGSTKKVYLSTNGWVIYG